MKDKKLQPKQKVTQTPKTIKLSKLSVNELKQVSGGWGWSGFW
ncbi:MAG: bacteriocin [Xenococcus sp. MO_188.B8]|nr:bacteriocin [Xenococcus sp. MO_188.B8]